MQKFSKFLIKEAASDKISVWLDDERDPTTEYIKDNFGSHGDEVWVKSAEDAIALLKTKSVRSISLDHDLGNAQIVGTGMDVINWIEEAAFEGKIPPLQIYVHSQNTVAKPRMLAAAKNAQRYFAASADRQINEGGAAAHMSHPYELDEVSSGNDLIAFFKKVALSLQATPAALKLDGVNASIKVVKTPKGYEFAFDRGSSYEDDLKGVTVDRLRSRFQEGHGFIKIGQEILPALNSSISKALPILNKLGVVQKNEDDVIVLNTEYVNQKTNVVDYGSKKFLAIHGLRRLTKKPSGKSRESSVAPSDRKLIDRLAQILDAALESIGFNVFSTIPSARVKKIDFSKALSQKISISGDPRSGGTLDSVLKSVKAFSPTMIKLKDGKSVANTSLRIYKIANGLDDQFSTLKDAVASKPDYQSAVSGALMVIGNVLLGDAVLGQTKLQDTSFGDLLNHEGIVINDDSIASDQVKITGSFFMRKETGAFAAKESKQIKESAIPYGTCSDYECGMDVLDIVRQDYLSYPKETYYHDPELQITKNAFDRMVRTEMQSSPVKNAHFYGFNPDHGIAFAYNNNTDIHYFFLIQKRIEEAKGETVTLVPGSFKPPHLAHFDMVQHYAKKSDICYVIISDPQDPKSVRKTPDGKSISADTSKKIFEIYAKEYGISNVEFIITTSPPVRWVYEYVGETAKSGSTIILGVSDKADDTARYASITKYAKKGVEVKIDPFKAVGGSKPVSATDFRSAISTGNRSKIASFLPTKLSTKSKAEVIDLLLKQ